MSGIEILEHNESGFKALVHFGDWRVAILKPFDKNLKRRFGPHMERHMQTDEVFVLLEGSATLFIGEDKTAYEMEKNKLYNVKKGTWHQVKMSEDCRILLVENDNTGRENSEYMKLDVDF